MRAVVDPNVLISALLTPAGIPAQLLERAHGGEFELIVSERLIAEFSRALEYPQLKPRLTDAERAIAVSSVRELGFRVSDPESPSSVRSPDPGDEYLLVLIEAEESALVTGDKQLQGLLGRIPVFSPRQFLELLEARN